MACDISNPSLPGLFKPSFKAVATTVIATAIMIAAGPARANDGPFTVQDAVTAEWYVDVTSAVPVLGSEGEAYLDAVTYSPDGKRAAFLTRQGEFASEATIITLHLATITDGTVIHRELVQLSSSSNRPPISGLRWISNDRIGFIGIGKGSGTQVMSANMEGKLIIHARSDGDIVGFDIGGNGTTMFTVSDLGDISASVRSSVAYVVDDETLVDIIGLKGNRTRRPAQYFISKEDTAKQLNGLLTGTSVPTPFISISPSGQYAVVANGPTRFPAEWEKFPLRFKTTAGAPVHNTHLKLSLVDLDRGDVFDISGAPMAWPRNKTQIIWDESNDRLFVIDQFVSSEQSQHLNDLNGSLRPATFEFSLKTKRPSRLIDVSAPPTRFGQGAPADDARINSANHNVQIVRGDQVIRYKETLNGWRRNAGFTGATTTLRRPFALKVHQSVEEPAQMYAVIDGRSAPIPVGEINAHLKAKFNPAKLYRWTDEAGLDWKAGLILPKDAKQGEALPLVIQTHTFSPHEFVITGPRGSSAGFSGQALASAGFAVLNMGLQRREIVTSAEEFETQSDGYRTAIKALSKDGLIDPTRVGIVAWSRSGFWLQHALAFSEDLFSAAIASDPSSFGKFLYLYLHNSPSAYQADYLTQNGSSPFGEGLGHWRARDPVTHVKAFTTPLLIEEYGEGLPSWWEPYVAMKGAREPVEYIIFPDAPHDPMQPQHRLVVQILTLDWFRFWLLGEEDPNPNKAKRYARWRALRAARKGNE